MVAAAVTVFITCGMKSAPFEFLEKEPFETEYGVDGMLRERKQQYAPTFTRYVVLGVMLCILAAVPLFLVAMITEAELAIMAATCGTLILVGMGVVLFIIGGMPWSAMEKLLQEGDYTPAKKKHSSKTGAISTVYWLVVTAIYLAYSFTTMEWHRSWIIWPVAGVLFGALMALMAAFADKREHP